MQLIKNVIDSTQKKIEQLKPTKYAVNTYTYRPNAKPWRRGDPEETITIVGDKHNPDAELKIKHTPYPGRRGKKKSKGAYCYIQKRCKVRYNTQPLQRKAA